MKKITLLFVCAGILIAAPSSYGKNKKGYLEAVYGDLSSKEIQVFNTEKPKGKKKPKTFVLQKEGQNKIPTPPSNK